MASYIITAGGLTVMVAGKPYTVESNHPNYDAIVEAIKADNVSAIPNLVSPTSTIADYVGNSNGGINVDVEAGMITYNGVALHNYLVDRILNMMNEGFKVQPLVNFLENLMQNPSNRAVNELYGFLEYGKLPITEDGHFLAYKRVNDNYTSVHDSKTDNSIGKTVSMPRNMVDDRSTNTCSNGLHFCSHEYLSSFAGARIVILKINPRDVVSIPVDYNNTKGRACQYEVIGELTNEQKETVREESVLTAAVIITSDVDDSDHSDDSPFDVNDLTPDEFTMYVDAYQNGYREGRNKKPYFCQGTTVVQQGYQDGYRDGKGHKPKICK